MSLVRYRGPNHLVKIRTLDFIQRNVIAPGAAYNGTAGSGWVSPNVEPVDPARSTAKPACRLMVAPRQAFTDKLVVGVYAGANYNGSLVDNMGLIKVRVHYEGNVVDILKPTIQMLPDANGNLVSYFGWWISLNNDNRYGLAKLYFEAFPKNTAMQKRVIGPFVFLPSADQYDDDVTVDVTQAADPSVKRYASIGGALDYLRGASRQHPRITITQPFEGDIVNPLLSYTTPQGYCTIEATAPVTFKKLSGNAGPFNPNYARLRFRGRNIKFDMQYISSLTPTANYLNPGNLQLDGVTFSNSGGRNALWLKNMRNSYLVPRLDYPIPDTTPTEYVQGESPWFSECSFDNTVGSAMQRAYARGCKYKTVGPDLADQCALLIGSVVDNIDNYDLRNPVSAMTVKYTGTGDQATIIITDTGDGDTSGFGQNSRKLTAKVTVGSTVDIEEFIILGASTESGGNQYNVSNVVDWFNGLQAGNPLQKWVAVLGDDTRKAAVLGLYGQITAFPETNAKTTTPVTLTTHFEFHPDLIQRLGEDENVIVADNAGLNIRAQHIFITQYSFNDMLVVNNCFTDFIVDPPIYYVSQLGGVHNHVVLVHNSLSYQQLSLRNDVRLPPLAPFPHPYIPDSYCLIANNTFTKLGFTGPVISAVKVADNHLQAGAAWPDPLHQNGNTVGGTAASLFVDVDNGDFTPKAGGMGLLSYLKTPVVNFDQLHAKRADPAPVGGIAAP